MKRLADGGQVPVEGRLGTGVSSTSSVLRVERNPAPIRAQVVDNLRQAILDRQLKPGQRLVERELVELTGVSRTSIREALRELAAEGLVTSVPNKGIVVASVTAEEARQLYQVRSALEGLAGRLFTENSSSAQRNALVKMLRRIERTAAKGGPLRPAKDQFYEVLFEGGGNEALRDVVRGLHARISVLRSLSLSVPGRPDETVAEMRAIVDAVLAGDAQGAEKASIHHVEQAGRVVQQALADQESK
jgi:DNA-binding GntR family transcriptional regulator